MNSIPGRHRQGQFTHQQTGSFATQTCQTSTSEGSNSQWISK